jgi:hypothetical protein
MHLIHSAGSSLGRSVFGGTIIFGHCFRSSFVFLLGKAFFLFSHLPFQKPVLYFLSSLFRYPYGWLRPLVRFSGSWMERLD